MNVAPWLAYAAAAIYAVLAVMVVVHRAQRLAKWLFILGLLAFAFEALFAGLSFGPTLPEEVARWQRWRLVPRAMIPSIWLMFALSYARGNYRIFVSRWLPVVVVLAALPLVLVAGFGDRIVIDVAVAADGRWFLAYGWAGTLLNLTVLLGSVLILMHLERTFRTAIGVMRWRIKYMVLGLALVFGVKIYAASQELLYSGVDAGRQTLCLCALLVAAPMIGLALLRTRLGEADVYPSQAVLHHSLTAVMVGLYLLITGVLAKLVTAYGGDVWFPVKSFVILLALVGLTILLLSDRIRQRTAFWVSRHFHRPLYDYRKTWSLFTQRTNSLLDEVSLAREVVKLTAETFNLLSVSLWLVDEAQREVQLAASTSLAPDTARPLALSDPAVAALRTHLTLKPIPHDLGRWRPAESEILSRCDPEFFNKGGNRVCLPLVSSGEFLGWITIADRVSGFRFSTEDFELLKCIGDQVAASLHNLRLSQRVLQAKQMEAFQTLAAFFVHDLKNTAATVSLITQNMATHFGDPDFRQDALGGLTRSVQHLNGLISRLAALRQNLQANRVEGDLNAVVRRVMAGLGSVPEIEVTLQLEALPRFAFDAEQMEKVVTNLVLNAREAIAGGGGITVGTGVDDGWATLTVEDDGCGMAPDFISRRLFKPFQSTKKKGLGIGMLHCRMIVDAHQGRIEVESQEGKGTQFRVLLPLQASQT